MVVMYASARPHTHTYTHTDTHTPHRLTHNFNLHIRTQNFHRPAQRFISIIRATPLLQTHLKVWQQPMIQTHINFNRMRCPMRAYAHVVVRYRIRESLQQSHTINITYAVAQELLQVCTRQVCDVWMRLETVVVNDKVHELCNGRAWV